jgi:hypothetical protein
MSSSQPVLPHPGGRPRVRDRAREAVALMAFSALSSGFLAGGLVLLTQVGR